MSSVVDLVQLYWREEKLGRFAMPFSNISKLNRGPIDSSKSHRTTMPNLLQRNFPWAFLYINDSGTGRGSCYTVSSCPSVSQVMPTKPNLLEVRHLTYFATLFLEPASCSPPSTSSSRSRQTLATFCHRRRATGIPIYNTIPSSETHRFDVLSNFLDETLHDASCAPRSTQR